VKNAEWLKAPERQERCNLRAIAVFGHSGLCIHHSSSGPTVHLILEGEVLSSGAC